MGPSPSAPVSAAMERDDATWPAGRTDANGAKALAKWRLRAQKSNFIFFYTNHKPRPIDQLQ